MDIDSARIIEEFCSKKIGIIREEETLLRENRIKYVLTSSRNVL